MIAFPVIFANILQTLYQLIDTYWVGRLGASAVASVSLSFPILFFLISFAMGFAMAGSILVAQYNGKNDNRNVAMATGQTISLVSLVSLVFSILGYFLSHYFISFLTTDAFVLEQATSYLQISFIGIIPMFLYIIFQSSLRGVGEVKFPTIIILITVIINFFIDPLFMYGWKFITPMGVSGVAIATVITQLLSAIIGIFILFKGYYGIKIELRHLKLNISWVKKLFKLGLPSSIEQSSRSFGMVLMTFLVSGFGTLIVGAYGIGTRILSFVIIPAIGFSISTSALVGNNLGAKQFNRADEIVRTGMKISFVLLSLIGILLFYFAYQISNFFVPGELELISLSTQFIRYMALTFGFIGIQMVVFGTLKASGKTTTSMFLALFHTISLLIISFVLSHILNYGAVGIWIAYPFANLIALIIALYYFNKKEWLNDNLV